MVLKNNVFTTKVGVLKIQSTTITSQANNSNNQSSVTTTTSNNASCTTTQVLPKLEIPASTTIQIQSSNQSLANTAQVCIDAMPLADVDVCTLFLSAKLSVFFSSVIFSILILFNHIISPMCA
jgi:hypothetical protein